MPDKTPPTMKLLAKLRHACLNFSPSVDNILSFGSGVALSAAPDKATLGWKKFLGFMFPRLIRFSLYANVVLCDFFCTEITVCCWLKLYALG